MYSAIPGRCGACQNRLQDCRRALSRLMTAMSPAVAGGKSIVEIRGFDHFGAPKRDLQAVETGFQQSGNDGLHDNVGLAIRPILHAPLDGAAGPLRLDVQRSGVIRRLERR